MADVADLHDLAARATEAASEATPGPWVYEYRVIEDFHFGPMWTHVIDQPGDESLCAVSSPEAKGADFKLAALAPDLAAALPEALRQRDEALAALGRLVDEIRDADGRPDFYDPLSPGSGAAYDAAWTLHDALSASREQGAPE